MKQPEDNMTADLLDNTSKRGRKALPAIESVAVELETTALAEAGRAATAETVSEEMAVAYAPLYQAMGRMQVAQFMETVSARVLVDSYLLAKESLKKIERLPWRLPSGAMETISDIDQFCRVALGKSDRRMRQIIDNMHTVGEDLFEQSEALGLRNKDYAALRALPDDSKAAVIQAIESGSKDQVLDLLQEFAVRVEAAKREAADAKETGEARQKLLDEEREKSDRLRERLEKPYKPGKDAAAKTAQEKIFLDALEESAMKMKGLMTTVTEVMTDMGNEGVSQSCLQAAHVNLQWLAHSLAEVMTTHGIELDLAELVEPTWVREAKKRAAGGAA